jgi:hypothetical protein
MKLRLVLTAGHLENNLSQLCRMAPSNSQDSGLNVSPSSSSCDINVLTLHPQATTTTDHCSDVERNISAGPVSSSTCNPSIAAGEHEHCAWYSSNSHEWFVYIKAVA